MGSREEAPKSALFRAAGADGFVVKPVHRDQIAAYLNLGPGPSSEQQQRQMA